MLLESIKKNISTNIFRWSGIFLLCFALIYTLLDTPPNASITYQYYEMGFDKIIFLICIFTLLIGLKDWWGYAIGITATLSLFALPLIYKWQTADNFLLLGGFFPQLDAADFFANAQRLMRGLTIMGTAAYRPIYSSFLAVLMKLTNSNLQWILIILVMGNAFATYFAAQEIRQVLKSDFASAFYLILVYLFYRRFSGTLLTENLGLCLGNLAMIFLLRGSFQNKSSQILYGIFLLTIALNVRAGAFLLLPVLATWLGISFREVRGFWRPFFLGCFIILIGMVANFAVARLTTSSESRTFSNYSYTLYGLASGNKGWEQAAKDYPGAGTNEIYSLAIQKIMDNPPLFFWSILGAYKDYFESSTGAFSFLVLEHDRGDIANVILWLLTFFGIMAAFVNGKQKIFNINLALFVGIFLSVSLVPPADSQRMRAYAATIPLTGYIIAAGIVFLSNLLKKDEVSEHISHSNGADLPLTLSILLLFTCLILPVFIKSIGKPITPGTRISCREDAQAHTVSVAKGSSIRLSSQVNNSYIPNLEISQFTKKIIRAEQQIPVEDKPFFLNMTSGTIITLVGGSIDPDGVFTPAISLITTDMPVAGSYSLCITPTLVDGFYFANLNDAQKTALPIAMGQRLGLNNIFRIIQISALVAVFLILLIDFSWSHGISSRKTLLAIVNSAILDASILFILHHFGILPLAWEQQIIDATQVRQPGSSNLFSINIGTDKISDTKFTDFPVSLYEDRKLLGPPHESQSLIDIYGGGGHILKGNFLYFSSSDNSDPRANGREYVLKWPMRSRLRYQAIAYGGFLLSLIIRFLLAGASNKNQQLH